ncbi:nucleotide-diphospho-sugar transferase [Vararia minispora EC-137]|uniref:Nucleotide-diphospho-sugar transferase n=1 Tax=Vararia minispora EC-137 TaxID=1314806 RepID=A0ACB8QGB3_9AGAM|nr:nucleotide-diphospho-sugar transferase [Vararia minispora EC-137]
MKLESEQKYRFTENQDWFSFNADTWRALFPRIQSSTPRALEIGTWEGRSAVFLLQELCRTNGSLTCIDHFDLMNTAAGRERYSKVVHNLTSTGKAFRILDEFSTPALMKLLEESVSADAPGYDFIYIDGSHEADDTFLDGELAWRLARKEAIVIFDDYNWNVEPMESRHHPKRGIDAFMALHAAEYEQLSSPTQYQMILQKKSEMRIGFLLKQGAVAGFASFRYGINIAYAVNEAFVMPLSVSLRSLLLNTSVHVRAYIFVNGVSRDSQENVRHSLPSRDNFSIQFLELPSETFATEWGISWAKIDMIKLLPVERALYLDADTLIRKDIRSLWETDLQGMSIAAVPDVGYPFGADASEANKTPYFNAGILLFDLARARRTMLQLFNSARAHRNSRFGDQDALNAHFKGDWVQLSLAWNAQGQGTYAMLPSPDREGLNLSSMVDPGIVHFTGPVHPPMKAVLNDWGQPFTAKPWGYAGAPGHPYTAEWWGVLSNTAWKGYRDGDVFRKMCEDEAKKAEDAGVALFRERVATSVLF